MNELKIVAGTDVPIAELGLTLHQPTVKEISYLDSELAYFLTLQFFGFDRRIILAQQEQEGNSRLNNLNDFDIFMTLLTDPKVENRIERQKDVLSVLMLFFPDYVAQILPRSIYLNNPKTKHNVTIDGNNFNALKEVIVAVGGLRSSDNGQNGSFNPKGKMAAKIAAKLMRGRQRAAIQKHEGKSNGVLGRYVSILTVGLHLSLTECLNMTVCQIYDLVERYGLWVNWDLDIKSRLAGGKPEDKPDDWMKDIH